MAQNSGLMQGKRGLVMGVANDHSIAWGIARTLSAHGAEIAFTYQGDAQAKRLRPLIQALKLSSASASGSTLRTAQHWSGSTVYK